MIRRRGTRRTTRAAREGGTRERAGAPGWGTERVESRLQEKLTALERYLRRDLTGSGPRPRSGQSIGLALEHDDCGRIRTALRRLAVDSPVQGELALAATELEVSTGEVLAFLEGRQDPVTIEFDLGDCALMAFALLSAASRFETAGADPTPSRTLGRRLFERMARVDEGFPEPDDRPAEWESDGWGCIPGH